MTFDRERLTELLASDIVADHYVHLLRWLIWFPLLTTCELTRLEQSRLGTRSESRTAALLSDLQREGLIMHLQVKESGWPLYQHRYALTDAGLSVFAAHLDLSVSRLVQAYPVERADLMARLTQTSIMLALSDFVSQLCSSGKKLGYPLLSYQQPWVQSDTVFGRKHFIHCDAAFLLGTPQGTEHAFYVRVDVNERHIFDEKREREWLRRLLNLRHDLHIRRETMPTLLILTSEAHLHEWREVLITGCDKHGTALLSGIVTTMDHLRSGSLDAPIWWTTTDLRDGTPSPSQCLWQQIGSPVSLSLAERFSQRHSFEHLCASHQSMELAACVGSPLAETIMSGPALAAALLHGTKAERAEAVAWLNLTLSESAKNLIFWLAHHPLLTLSQLAELDGGKQKRTTQIQMNSLRSLDLLVSGAWYKAEGWQERERSVLSKAALCYCALREGKPANHYLLKQKKEYKVEAFSIQQGTAGLFAQIAHTHGVYECLAHLVAGTRKIRLITVRNARECIRKYRDPFAKWPIQVRPDAEIIYAIDGAIRHLLLEYDRATTSKREYETKYQIYADYQYYTGITLPPILVITQHERAARLIRSCIESVHPPLCTIIVLEENLLQGGLLAMVSAIS